MGTLTRLERKNMQDCTLCGHTFTKDKTQCPSCLKINIETNDSRASKDNTVLLTDSSKRPPKECIQTGPWDANFGKSVKNKKEVFGIVTTSVTLLGGAPGAGKSTLCLQVAAAIAARTKREVLIIAGEEDRDDIDERAVRLGIPFEVRKLMRISPMGEDIDLAYVLEKWKPAAIFVDSLPKVMPDPADAVEFAERIKDWTVKMRMPAIIIDHVTKEEEFAGQMALQHAVDGTLLFTVYEDGVRELKTVKNRNAPCIVTLLNMTEHGLEYRDPEDDIEDEEEDE